MRYNKLICILSIFCLIFLLSCSEASPTAESNITVTESVVPSLTPETTQSSSSDKDEELYQEGLSSFNDQDYEKSLRLFSYIICYKDSAKYLNESSYLLAKKQYDQGDYIKALIGFSKLDSYKDSRDLLKQGLDLKIKDLYKEAVRLYKNNEIENASDVFFLIPDYKDVVNYIKNIEILNSFKGTWQSSNSLYFTIDGLVLTYNYHSSQLKIKEYDNKYYLLQNDVELSNTYAYEIVGDTLVQYYIPKMNLKNISTAKYTTFDKYQIEPENNTTPTEEPAQKIDPYIGMTKEELKNNCSWGTPYDINKTTTASGVHEQWCYKGYKYVYVDDGIVTSIQE